MTNAITLLDANVQNFCGPQVSPSALYRWERRESRPHKIALRALKGLCPDEETRANFFVDIGEVSGKMFSTPRVERPKEQGDSAHAREMRYEQLPVKIPKGRRKR